MSFSKIEYKDISQDLGIPPIPKLEYPNIHYRCPKCFNFPLIEFINKNEEIIIYSCACYKGKRIFIQDLFDKEKKYMSFQSNPNKDSKIEEVVGYMCTEHKSYTSNSFIYNNFEYYCLTKKCNKNLCKKCIEEHLQDGHDILIFDYQNFETKKKVNEIIEFENKNKNNIILDNSIDISPYLLTNVGPKKYDFFAVINGEEINGKNHFISVIKKNFNYLFYSDNNYSIVGEEVKKYGVPFIAIYKGQPNI